MAEIVPQPTLNSSPTSSTPQTLQGKVIAITGAASGIGQAVAYACAARGAQLALSDLNIQALTKSVENAIRPAFPSAAIHIATCDVTSSASVDTWIASVVQHYGRLDGACNIAGVETQPGERCYKPITEMTDEHWKFIHEVNLNGTFYCVRAQVRVMKRGASIVNTASTAGLKGSARLSGYVSSKHAVVGFTKSLAKECGPDGIRVNAVCPGPIETPMLQRLMDDIPNLVGRFTDLPLGRLGQVEEVAKGFCYLLSDDSTWTTGTTLVIDGGSVV